MDPSNLLGLYRAMLTARQVDKTEQAIVNRGEAFFHVSGAGHEGSAAIASHLHEADWLFCHYRDKALALARGLSARAFFDGLLCNEQSSSCGRQMSAHLSDRALNIVSMPGPVGNSAPHAVGVAKVIRNDPQRPVVYCAVGDGTTQEGEFLEACGEAARNQLPLLFLVEDNRWAISTPTVQKTFYSHPYGVSSDFHGIPIHRIDGRQVVAAHQQFGTLLAQMRRTRQPQIAIFEVERLANHTNADDQSVYRSREEIQRSHERGDPLRNLEQHLLQQGWSQEQLAEIRRDVQQHVAAAEAEAFEGSEPAAILTAKRPVQIELTHPSRERRGIERGGTLTMKDALREVLRHHLSEDPRVTLYGEDIEDPKGDVFGVTKGLSTQFTGRVANSPLAEATIVGTAIGQALAGMRPVAFLQFADFLPLAYNQIVSELGSIDWRSNGQWTAPVIVMVPCGGYRPGQGPIHSQSKESIVAHVPGVDVFMPSTASDAAGLLNAAFRSRRPSVFFYPKSLLNDPSQATSPDVADQFVPIGVARKARVGRDITFVGWGNTVRICQRAAEALENAGVESEILDLRSISPWDEHAVLASAEKTARLVVVHEDNHFCGVGAEVIATVAEKARLPVAMRRVSRSDTYIPCNFENQIEVLPSFRRVLTTAAELLNLDLSWVDDSEPVEDGLAYVEAIGSGPSDETVVVVELTVREGTQLQRGDVVGSLEATKSVFEITSPVSGTVEKILVHDGETVAVGAPLIAVRAGQSAARKKPLTHERPGQPLLTRKKSSGTLVIPRRIGERRAFDVGISHVATVTGGRLVSNADLVATRGDHVTADDIVRRTGIEQRHWAEDDEDAVNLAVRACWSLLDGEQLIIDDLDLVICSTTSPTVVTPSMACQVLNGLSGGKTDAMIQAYDINAACSGYLYALQAGYDYLQSTPNGRVLVVTAEVLSPLLDPNDFDTAILFGDATSATVLYGESHFDQAKARLFRPDLSAKSEDGSTLSVPFRHHGYIQMKGRKVFSEAVRAMVTSLNRVCQREGITVDDLNLVVPHQANQRIIDAIQNRIHVSVFSNIRTYGNTSSSSIPLCLTDLLPQASEGDRLGLCAFGGGFTFGAGILQAV